MKKHYDFIVIGGGSAGYAGARTMAAHGRKVAVVDGAGELGGLCILRGCMPSKTLIYTAELLHHARNGDKFGLKIPQADADMAAIQARKKAIIKDFAEYRVGQLESGRFDLFRNTAAFEDSRTVRLNDGQLLSADYFLVATGSVVNWPSIPGLDRKHCVTSDEILDLDTLPESVIVLGGGIVACELAQFLARMGSKVTQIQRSLKVLKDMSSDLADVVMQAFRDEGIELFTDTILQSIEACGSQKKTVTFKHDGREIRRSACLVLNALGRKPDTAKLNLEKAGVQVQISGQVKTDRNQQSSNPRIYAAGDCAGPHEIVHVAIMQGEIAADHAAGKEIEPVNYDHLVTIVFTDPQVASAGLIKKQLLASGIRFLEADYPFNDHGKSMLMEANYGYVKVFAEAETGKLLGAECVGKDAGELIHSLAVGISLGASAKDILKTHWYHPTLSEIWSYPLEDIVDELG